MSRETPLAFSTTHLIKPFFLVCSTVNMWHVSACFGGLSHMLNCSGMLKHLPMFCKLYGLHKIKGLAVSQFLSPQPRKAVDVLIFYDHG